MPEYFAFGISPLEYEQPRPLPQSPVRRKVLEGYRTKSINFRLLLALCPNRQSCYLLTIYLK
jgi:hypothetical protein